MVKVKIDYEATTSPALRNLVAEIQEHLKERYQNAGVKK